MGNFAETKPAARSSAESPFDAPLLTAAPKLDEQLITKAKKMFDCLMTFHYERNRELLTCLRIKSTLELHRRPSQLQ